MPNYNQELTNKNNELNEILSLIQTLPESGSSAKPEVDGRQVITKNGIQTFSPPEGSVYRNFTADVNVPSQGAKIQNKPAVTPTKSQQIISADPGYDGLGPITITSIPAKYPDVSNDNVNSNNLLEGGTAHNNAGQSISGGVKKALTKIENNHQSLIDSKGKSYSNTASLQCINENLPTNQSSWFSDRRGAAGANLYVKIPFSIPQNNYIAIPSKSLPDGASGLCAKLPIPELTPTNIRNGVNILGVQGEMSSGGTQKPEETKEISITTNGRQEFYPTAGHVINKVVANVNCPEPKPEESLDLTITANETKTYYPKNTGNTISSVTVTTNIPTSGGGTSGDYNAEVCTITASNLKIDLKTTTGPLEIWGCAQGTGSSWSKPTYAFEGTQYRTIGIYGSEAPTQLNLSIDSNGNLTGLPSLVSGTLQVVRKKV